MFIEKMTNVELLSEYNADLKDIQKQMMSFSESSYVTSRLLKHRKQQRVVITKIFKSLRGNRYLGIMLYFRKDGKGGNWEWTSYHIGLMHTFKGTAALAFYLDSGMAVKFTPHFFNRYRERFCKVCDWQTRNSLDAAKTTEELIGIYIKRNLSTTWIETESVFKDKVHIFAPVNDGVTLLQWDKRHKILQANTFVTMDMLDNKQTEMVKYAIAYLSMTEEERKRYKFPDFVQNDESSEITA